MIKSILITALVVSTALYGNAQYYYKDIVSNNQLLAEMALLKEQKIRSVKVTGTDDDGRPSEGFMVEKQINRNYTLVEILSRSAGTATSFFTSRFTKDGLLIQTVDSSDIAVNRSNYIYDDRNRIKSIQAHLYSRDDDFTTEITEDHNYEYDAKGVLLRMYKIKNGRDTSLILFSTDEKNNVAIEKNTKSGTTYYYYYDNKNRLTDVVHQNPFSLKMLPDYMFEYNNAGNITQMTSTEEGGSYYYIWKYTYNNGLRVREKCFSKERRLLGTVEYAYK